MAGIGLTSAVVRGINAHRLRRQDDQDDEDRAIKTKQRDLLERANAAGAAMLGDNPDGFAIIKAFDARGRAFVEGGDFEGFMKNEASAASARLKARGMALQQYQQDGDFEKLARSAYSTFPDGDEIDKVEMLTGGTSGLKGAPAGPDQVRLTTKKGRIIIKPQQAIVQGIAGSLQDPVATMQAEAKISLETAIARAKQGAEQETVRVKGDEDRKTERVKQDNRLGLESVEQAGRVKVAGIQAAASKYSADKGLEGRKYATDNDKDKDGNKRLRSDALQRLVINSGIGITDAVTGQARGNEDSNAVALRAEQWLNAYPDMSELEAVNKAVGEFRARKPRK